MRVLLAGGGSGGSAAPVIAVAEALAKERSDAEFLYMGTASGPEAALVREAGLPYVAVCTGRFRRYLTWRNLTDPFLVIVGIAQAFGIVKRFRPDVAFGAGGFATVPPLLAARLNRVPIGIHQQDLVPGLANRMLAPFATQVTVAFSDTLRAMRGPTAAVVGNPVRSSVFAGTADRARERFGLHDLLPVVLITGGGTGAVRLNEIGTDAARILRDECQIIHLTGAGRAVGSWAHPNYHPYEFLAAEMADALAAADVVVTRAGMSSLAEVAALQKAAIIIPMPGSHQEANAAAFQRRRGGMVVDQNGLTAEALAASIRSLLAAPQDRAALGAAAAQVLTTNAADTIARDLIDLVAA